MTRRTIPARHEVVCDGCKEVISGPENRLIVHQVGRDYSGHPVGGSDGEYDFCDACMLHVVAGVNAAIYGKDK